jgi:hypothetical protein
MATASALRGNEESAETPKAPYRVRTDTQAPNPQYARGSLHYPVTKTSTYKPFDTLETARAYRDQQGEGTVQKLTASGESYKTV